MSSAGCPSDYFWVRSPLCHMVTALSAADMSSQSPHTYTTETHAGPYKEGIKMIDEESYSLDYLINSEVCVVAWSGSAVTYRTPPP